LEVSRVEVRTAADWVEARGEPEVAAMGVVARLSAKARVAATKVMNQPEGLVGETMGVVAISPAAAGMVGKAGAAAGGAAAAAAAVVAAPAASEDCRNE